jgi:hypothetical protein
MIRWRRDESGQLEIGAGLLALAALLALPLILTGIQDVQAYRAGKWDRKEKVNPPPAVTIPALKTPPMPASPPERVACYNARRGGLRWDNTRGWRHDGYPPPHLTGVYAKDDAAVQEWLRQMQGLISDANFVAECDTPDPPPPAPEEVPADPNVQGVYDVRLAYQGGPPSQCNTQGYVAQYRVTQPVKGRVTIDIGGGRVFQAMLASSLSFDGEFTGLGPRDTIRGYFTGSDDQRTMDSGTVIFGAPDGDTSCSYTFTGVRIGR